MVITCPFITWLHGTLGNTNYFTFPVNAYYYRRIFMFEDKYLAIKLSLIKPKRETKIERKQRFEDLVNKNGWSRAELARHLGSSRAWVTKVMSS